MATSARTVREKIDGRNVKVQMEKLRHEDYEVKFTFTDLDQEPRERWEFNVDDDRDAHLITTTEDQDEAADPDPPEWIREAMFQFDIEVA